jgi:hypothetical protein
MDREHIFAYDINKNIVHYSEVDFTNKNVLYFFDDQLKNEFINVAGHINKHHWRLKVDIDLRTDKYIDYTQKNFLTHKNAEKYFIKNKTLVFLDATIEANKVVAEHEAKKAIKSDKYIPDLVFLDDKNNPICIVEIFITNKKSKKHIEYYKTLDIPCFEVAYEKGCEDFKKYLEIKLLNYEIKDEKGVAKSFEQSLHEAKKQERMVKKHFITKSSEIEERIRSHDRTIEILQRKIDENRDRDTNGYGDVYIAKIAEAESKIKKIPELERSIESAKQRISRIKQRPFYQEYKGKPIKEQIQLITGQISIIEKQISKIKGLISWEENRSKQANTIIKRNF